jgi:metal-responsive CopG/Arc/MetJ family transcriptional regulator
MSDIVRFGVSLEKELLEKFDKLFQSLRGNTRFNQRESS